MGIISVLLIILISLFSGTTLGKDVTTADSSVWGLKNIIEPVDLAVDNGGTIFAIDGIQNNIQVFNSNGRFSASFGKKGKCRSLLKSNGELRIYTQSSDVKDSGLTFCEPVAITIGQNNIIYLLDFDKIVYTLRYKGFGNVELLNKADLKDRLNSPSDITTDPTGLIYISNTKNHRIEIYDSKFNHIRSIGDPMAIEGKIKNPISMMISGNKIYILDEGKYSNDADTTYNREHRILTFNTLNGKFISEESLFRPFEFSGEYLKIDNGFSGDLLVLSKNGIMVKEDWIKLEHPKSFALDRARGRIIVAGKNKIEAISPEGRVSWTIASRGNKIKEFDHPISVATIGEKAYVLDSKNKRVQVFSIDGKFISEWRVNESSKNDLTDLKGITAHSELLYILDRGNEKITAHDENGVQKFQFGKFGSEDGSLKEPSDITSDSAGNIYIANTGNNRVEVFNKRGDFITIAQSNEMKEPNSIFTDNSYLYVLHKNDNNLSIWEIKNNDGVFEITPFFETAIYKDTKGIKSYADIAVIKGKIYAISGEEGKLDIYIYDFTLTEPKLIETLGDPPHSGIKSKNQFVMPNSIFIDKNLRKAFITDQNNVHLIDVY